MTITRLAGQDILRKAVIGALMAASVLSLLPSSVRASDFDSPVQVANVVITAGASPTTAAATAATAGSSLASSISHAAVATKEYVLDTLAWQVVEVARKSIVKSLVNWINNGFQGSPAFVGDIKQNLRGVGDAVASHFFDELTSQVSGSKAKSPFQNKILNAARLGYYLSTSPESFYTRYPYTLDQVSSNDRAFLDGDFKQGGWNAWVATLVNPTNNPYGAEMVLNQALTDAVEGATGDRVQELAWNKGFLSWRGDCKAVQKVAPTTDTLTTLAGATTDADGNITVQTNTQTVSLSQADKCVGYNIKTPGSVISEQLNKTLGSNIDKLVSADELDEVIGALLNQLVGHVLGTNNGGGLADISRPASGGGSSLLDQATGADNAAATSATTNGKISETLSDQKIQLDEFNAAWTKIRTAAVDAKTKCDGLATTTEPGAVTPDKVIQQADSELAKGAKASLSLESLEVEIAAASDAAGDQTEKLYELANRFQELQASTLPSALEYAQAMKESQETAPTVVPGSLYSQMTKYAAQTSCTAN